ncbi:MAG: hypothetical protein SPK00_09475 [Corynebacterium glucuronolyticum]|nr:hypothetical protein [Mycobacteriaceae bacterium]MDY5834960.1 hypothetical protein [Corynebacterium glucuronolyticum]
MNSAPSNGPINPISDLITPIEVRPDKHTPRIQNQREKRVACVNSLMP